MNIKTGYKQTEIGVIPEDWEVKNFGDVLKVRHGKSQHDVVVTDGEFPILATGGEIGRTNHYLYNKPSVLIGRKGTIDAPQYVEMPFWTIDTLFYTEIAEKTSTKFIFYKFQTINWRGYNEASGVPSLNASTIERINFANPPLPEQTAIAAALSDVDALIGELDKLIAKKRDIKQATMQQLLTGKKRLAGFSGEWEVVKAGDIGKFRGDNGFPTAFQGQSTGKYPFFKVSDMNLEGNEICMESANNYIDETIRKQIGIVVFPENSIVFAKVGAAIFLERKKILVKPSCIDNNMAAFVLNDEKTDCNYIRYLFLNTKLGDLVSTTALPSLSGSVLNGIEWIIPPPSEQTAIATILSDMDAEINALQQKRDKTTQLKQGMMQELLTGRIRLIVND